MFSLLICHSTSLARKPIVFDAWLVLRLPQAFQHFPDWRLSTRRRRSWTLNGSTVPRTRETSVASSRCGWLMILPWPKKGSTIHWCPRQKWVVPGPFSPQTWSLWTCQELVMTMPCEMTLHRGSSRGQTSFVCVLGSTGRSRTRPRSSGSTNLCGTCPATMWPTWWQSVTTWVRTRSDATMGWDVALAARLQKSVTSSSRSSCQQNQCRCLLFRPGTMHDALVWRMEFPLRSWQKRPRRSQQCASTSSTQWSPARSRPSIRRLKDLGFMMARRKNPLPIACCFLIPTFLYLLQCYSPSGSTGQLSPSYATVFSAKSKGITNLLLDNPPIRRCWQLKQPLSVALHVSKHLYQILEIARRNKNSWRRSNGNCEPCRHRRSLCKWHSTMGPRSTPCLKSCWETSRRGWKAAGVRNFVRKSRHFIE